MTQNNSKALILEIDQLKQKLADQTLIVEKLNLKFNYLNLLFETLPNPVFYKDANGSYLGCNKAFEDFVGKDRTEIIGKTVYDMGPKEIADKYHEMDELLLTENIDQQYEWKVKNSKCEILDVIFNKSPVVNDDGSVTGLIGIITDITQRKNEEEILKISEEKFKKLSSSANDAIIQMNHKGEIVFWNPAAEKIFGYSKGEVHGKNLHKLLVPERYFNDFQSGIEIFKESGLGNVIGKKTEVFALRKDGSEFEIELSISSFKVHGTWNAVGIIRDISLRKAIEKEKEILLNNLKNALNEIKTLKGIVPICANCKKIRDDEGYWNHLEVYIQNHSQAEFSHGICPDCANELYPGIKKNIDK